jgi:hypothetical protein
MNDIVFVQGNILFKTGNHQVKELIAFASDGLKNIAGKKYNKDLIITEENLLMPYSIYCASEDIVSYGINVISGLQSPNNVFRIYCTEVENLKQLKNQEINQGLKEVLNRQIYIGVVGTMELFLSDFLYSMVLGYKKYFKKFCENSSQEFKLKEISTKDWNIPTGVRKSIIEINYHRIEIVENIFKKILSIKLPNTKVLKELIQTRHSLVHRNGYPSKDSEYIKVSEKMIDDLIIEVNKLVNHIMVSKRYEIENWLPNLTNKS